MRNIDVEQNILGAMIIDLNSSLMVKNRGVKSKDFSLYNHKELFDAINGVTSKYNRIDLLLLLEYLKSKNILTKVGGISYVTQISNSVATTANLNNYIDILLEYSSKREIGSLAEYIQNNLNQDIKALRSHIHSKILEIFEVGENEETPQEYGEEFIKLLNQRATGVEDSQGIKTGLFTLDETIGGFSKADLVTIFAFSSIGKTTLAGQIALNMIKRNKKILFFSLEMPARQVIERMVANLCSVEGSRMRKGEIVENEWDEIIKSTNYLCDDNRLMICGNSDFNEIIAKIQLEKIKSNIDAVFIDYIGLIQAPQAERRDLTIAIVTQSLKALARNLDIPIVALAQAKQSVQNKNSETFNINEKLSETDIAESASIFRDSDKVIGMYRNAELDDPIARKLAHDDGKLNYNSKDATVNPNCVNLLVKKCRNGTKATLSYLWEGQYFRIRNYER